MENPTPVAASTAAQSRSQDSNSPPLPGSGKRSSTRGITPIVPSLELIRALAVIQDGLRQFVLAGGMLRTPEVNDKGVMVLAIKLNDHSLGIGPEGNFTVDSISVMEGRQE